MRITQEGRFTLDDLQKALDDFRCGLLITGGEPTYSYHYEHALIMLKGLKYPVANVETNGFQLLKLLNSDHCINRPVKFIYSPKIFDEKTCYQSKQLTDKILDHRQVYIKVPYTRTEPVIQYCKWLSQEIEKRKNREYDNKVWLMPIGKNEAEQKENSAGVMDACEILKFNFTGRLHTMYNYI
jgi:organic radical activating enzyme